MKLYDIGEVSIENYSIMKNAVHLVNTFGNDIPCEYKPKVDIIMYKALKSQQHPISSTVHHYYYEQKQGEDLYSMVKDIKQMLHRIEENRNNNDKQQSNHDIDTKQPEQSAEQQGDSTTK
jgi:hypothetical protein